MEWLVILGAVAAVVIGIVVAAGRARRRSADEDADVAREVEAQRGPRHFDVGAGEGGDGGS